MVHSIVSNVRANETVQFINRLEIGMFNIHVYSLPKNISKNPKHHTFIEFKIEIHLGIWPVYLSLSSIKLFNYSFLFIFLFYLTAFQCN